MNMSYNSNKSQHRTPNHPSTQRRCMLVIIYFLWVGNGNNAIQFSTFAKCIMERNKKNNTLLCFMIFFHVVLNSLSYGSYCLNFYFLFSNILLYKVLQAEQHRFKCSPTITFLLNEVNKFVYPAFRVTNFHLTLK